MSIKSREPRKQKATQNSSKVSRFYLNLLIYVGYPNNHDDFFPLQILKRGYLCALSIVRALIEI